MSNQTSSNLIAKRTSLTTRSRSVSPSSSVESGSRRRRTSSGRKGKGIVKQLKSKEDVQVFTSLPPKVEGEIKLFLKLQITRINWLNSPNEKTNKPEQQLAFLNTIIARLSWWGEEASCSIFRPRVIGAGGLESSRRCQTTAKYVIRSGIKQFTAYLNDMKTLDVDLIDEKRMEPLAKVHIHEIGHMSLSSPIKGYYAAFDSNQLKVADVYVSMRLETLRDSLDTSKQSRLNESIESRSATPVVELSKRLQHLEQHQQQQMNTDHSLFNSNAYLNYPVDNDNNEDSRRQTLSRSSSNPIIDQLIERGHRLKSEMLKSTITSLQPNDAKEFDPINDTSFLSNYDPTIDPHLLSALIYNNNSNNPDESCLLMEDNVSTYESLKKLNEIDKMNEFNSKPIKSAAPHRRRHRSRSSMSSNCSSMDDDDEQQQQQMLNTTTASDRESVGRVSFELQSSDGESSQINDKCVDILSAQRISLLNLVQVAKLNIKKLTFLNTTFVNSLMERIGKLEQLDQSATTNAKSKPPKAIKSKASDLFFIEYQFPVIAQSRDEQANSGSGGPLMATQVMRVACKRPKRGVDEPIEFEHESEYAVLFNSQSLESWWRSVIVFKIYFRSLSSNGSTPYLIGTARLQLRNVLKSKNFRILKKLNIIDQLEPNSKSSRRIGTLFVSIELASDLKEFGADLVKLKSSESRRNSVSRDRSEAKRASPSPVRRREESAEKVAHQSRASQPILVSHLKSSTLLQTNHQLNNLKNLSIEEYSLPMQMYLSINDGRGFNIPNSNSSNFTDHINLICRLFWCKDKVKFEGSQHDSHHSLNLSFTIKPSVIENMKHNFMIIEAWKKSNQYNAYTASDSLLGTIKVPLNEFYLKFKDLDTLKQLLKDKNSQPMIGVNGWFASLDPFTGCKTGEINVLLAMGSNDQILNLQKCLFDQARVESNQPTANEINEHQIAIEIENILMSPSRSSHLANDMTLDEANLFVKYSFPVNESFGQPNQLTLSTFASSAKSNKSLPSKQIHLIRLDQTKSIENELAKLISLIRTNRANDLSLSRNELAIVFEVWLKGHTMPMRERLVAKGDLPFDKLALVIKNNQNRLIYNTVPNNFSNSIVIQLVSVDEVNTRGENVIDRFIGQLFLTIDYKLKKPTPEPLVEHHQLFEHHQSLKSTTPSVCLSVGILKLSQLSKAIKYAATKANIQSFSMENSEVFVKFSLSFLHRPHECKQTRCVNVHQNLSPELFDYFELMCPLTAKYSSEQRRTISLAEMIELGQITFEIWSRLAVNSNGFVDKLDLLVGVCTCSLEPLLDNRIGIKEFVPIKPLESSLRPPIASSHQDFGFVEVAIRFTRSDDHLTVLSAAHEIGWISARKKQQHQPDVALPPPLPPPRVVVDPIMETRLDLDQLTTIGSDRLSSANSRSRSGTIKCLLEIERAVHLPLIYDEKANRHQPPNTFITFSPNADNPAELVQTVVCESKISPSWNFQLVFPMDVDFFLDEAKYFVLKVWHKNLNDQTKTQNKIIGYVSIDLTPLLCGLSSINGWYNIQDSIGNCQGQLKLSVIPQESLSTLRQLNSERKKRGGTRMSSCDRRSANSVLFSAARFGEMPSSNDSRTIPPPPPSIVDTAAEEKEKLEDFIDLKSSLSQKLQELDQINRSLKEKYGLDRRAFSIGRDEQKDAKLRETPKKKEVNRKISTLNEQQPQQQQHHFDENLQQLPGHQLIQTVVFDDDAKANKLNGYDSFWASSIVADKSFDFEPNDSQIEEVANLNFMTQLLESNEREAANGVVVEHLPPIYSREEEVAEEPIRQPDQQEDEMEGENRREAENENDRTELDQTMNFYASYEPNNQRGAEANTIDCNDLDDQEVEIVAVPEEEEEEDEEDGAKEADPNNMQQSSGDDHENIFLDNENPNDSDECCVVVPEQLNNIGCAATDEQPTQSSEENERDDDAAKHYTEEIKRLDNNDLILSKLKQLSSKLPNYFLGQEELEKTMKKMHTNHKDIGSPSSISPANRAASSVNTTELLARNQSALKQDFSRINKIFHSKQNNS